MLVGVAAFLGSEVVLSPVVSGCLPSCGGWVLVGVAASRAKLFRNQNHRFQSKFAYCKLFGVYAGVIFSPLLFSRRGSIDTGPFFWAASRHRLFLYLPVSRCACGREDVSPDLPLPGWEATDKHGGGRVRTEVGERWKVSVLVVKIFEEQAGRKGSSCRIGKES